VKKLAFIALLAAGMAFAQGMGETVKVTLINNSPQLITPPIIIIHSLEYQPVVLGEEASPEVRLLAEEGDASELATVARVYPGVEAVTVAEEYLQPMESITLEITVAGEASYLTIMGMLATTNDAFFLVGGDIDTLEKKGMDMGMNMDKDKDMESDMGMKKEMGMGMAPELYDGVVRVLDAGTEANTELCAHIPGPPCHNSGVRVPEGAEGEIHLHPGIIGVGDLDPVEWDWTNPVVFVTVER
jgi:hypothetical protein